MIDVSYQAACILASLLNASCDTTRLFYDYGKREHYLDFWNYCAPNRMIGSMVELRATKKLDRQACEKGKAKYAIVTH